MTKNTYRWAREEGDWATARRAMQIHEGASVEADFDCYFGGPQDTARLVGKAVAFPAAAIELDGAPVRALKSLTVAWEAKS